MVVSHDSFLAQSDPVLRFMQAGLPSRQAASQLTFQRYPLNVRLWQKKTPLICERKFVSLSVITPLMSPARQFCGHNGSLRTLPHSRCRDISPSSRTLFIVLPISTVTLQNRFGFCAISISANVKSGISQYNSGRLITIKINRRKFIIILVVVLSNIL